MKTAMDISVEIYSAKRLLVLRNYKSCIEKCEEGLAFLQREFQVEMNQRGVDDFDVQEAQIAFGILGLQGLTLSGRHGDLDVFARKWFGCSRSFPSEILQICACHHLKNQDPKAAVDLTEDWLSMEQYLKRNGYDKVAEFYVRHILLPLKEIEKAECFLAESKSISSENKQKLLSDIEKIKTEATQLKDSQNTDDHNELCNSTSSVTSKHLPSRGPVSQGLFLKVSKLFKTIKQSVTSITSMKIGLASCGRLVVLAFFLYIVIFRTYLPGDIFNKGSSSSLWIAVKQAWSALFAPYHLI